MELITILGPTASGKTTLAVALANMLDTEIISADSRQIYRRMDIGTGKDLSEYRIGGHTIPCHLIDICEPGYKYNLFEYLRDFSEVFGRLRKKEKIPVVCGGTGLYIESALKGIHLPPVPENKELRKQLQNKSLTELTALLSRYKRLHNTTDTNTVKRAVRAIEIAEYERVHPEITKAERPLDSLIVGIDIDREIRRKKITERLHARLQEGMIEEVQGLLDSGIPAEDLIYYGLEYKYVTEYLTGKYTLNEMTEKLEIAIHQFAKRQMTWFRGMERRGFRIHWLDACLPVAEKLNKIREWMPEG